MAEPDGGAPELVVFDERQDDVMKSGDGVGRQSVLFSGGLNAGGSIVRTKQRHAEGAPEDRVVGAIVCGGGKNHHGFFAQADFDEHAPEFLPIALRVVRESIREGPSLGGEDRPGVFRTVFEQVDLGEPTMSALIVWIKAKHQAEGSAGVCESMVPQGENA